MQYSTSDTAHESVLLNETLGFVSPRTGGYYVDATLGNGGHSEAILRSCEGTTVLGIDQDPTAIELAVQRLAGFGSRFRAVHANFADLKKVLKSEKVAEADGVIADLGVSSMQFDSESRGFSFRFDAPLDMRMDPTSGETAANILADRSEQEIANIIYEFGEERASRRIARRIVERREAGNPVTTTSELAALVQKAIGRKPGDKIHPATRTFQALRIAVNHELDVIEGFLNDACDVLKTDGRFAAITFHSLEDRIVKQTFQRLGGKCICPPRIPKCICGAVKRVEILTKKPVVPRSEETERNPRSRSAKLRAFRKL
jgi:16S rRNA (cytosine1402-N4)-methyltransferase